MKKIHVWHLGIIDEHVCGPCNNKCFNWTMPVTTGKPILEYVLAFEFSHISLHSLIPLACPTLSFKTHSLHISYTSFSICAYAIFIPFLIIHSFSHRWECFPPFCPYRSLKVHLKPTSPMTHISFLLMCHRTWNVCHLSRGLIEGTRLKLCVASTTRCST